MNGFLSKPVEEPDLLATIASVLSAEQFPATPAGEPPVEPGRFDELTAALAEDWQDWLSTLDQCFRSKDSVLVAEVAREIEAWLAGLTAMPASRAAGQLAVLSEEGRLEAALHQRRSLLLEVNRLRTSTSSLEVPV